MMGDYKPTGGIRTMRSKMRHGLVILAIIIFADSVWCANAKAQQDSFNTYVLKSVQMLYATRKGGGYDMEQALTRDLLYRENDQCCVTAVPTPKPGDDHKTMCVAAVHEIIVEAVNFYAKDNATNTASLSKLPLIAFWSDGTKLDFRP